MKAKFVNEAKQRQINISLTDDEIAQQLSINLKEKKTINMRAKTLNEVNFGDDDTAKISGWMKMYHGDPDFKKTINVEPFKLIITDEGDFNKLKFLLLKYKLKFEILEPETVKG